ncbi:MAG: molybdopterin synthase catalytic subunit [Alphaproteobacteria bacterium]
MENIKTLVAANLQIDDAIKFTANDKHGAAASFVGYVRNHNENQDVNGLTYDVHEALAINIFNDIAKQAQEKYSSELQIYIAHANGYQPVGGIAVIVMVSSAHRAESLQACAWIIEEIKFKAPVWKKEAYLTGEQKWTKGHSLRDRIT